MLATHVDDMLWATKPGYEHMIQQLLDRYTLKSVETKAFGFCGREVTQHDDYSITVTCKDNIEKIEPIRFEMRSQKEGQCIRERDLVAP